MTIREKGYHTWDGELKQTGPRWMPIFRNGIKSAYNKRFAKLVFIFALQPFIGYLIAVYVSTRPELKMFPQLVKMLANEPQFFNSFLTNPFTQIVLMVLGLFFGAGLISGDIKSNSFPLYFSRPLDRKDYMLGKYSIILFYLLAFHGAAGILLYIFKVIFTGKLTIGLSTLIGLFIVPPIITFFLASLVLLISSGSRNSRYVQIIVFLVYIFSSPIARLLVEIFKSSYFYIFDIRGLIQQAGAYIFNVSPSHSYPAWMSLAFIVVLSVGICWTLYRRIRKLEAQIETSN
jgi:ABC-type transport system involved in multi-copper enzyme maturation permease subunit